MRPSDFHIVHLYLLQRGKLATTRKLTYHPWTSRSISASWTGCRRKGPTLIWPQCRPWRTWWENTFKTSDVTFIKLLNKPRTEQMVSKVRTSFQREKLWVVSVTTRFAHSLFVFVEEHSGPAGYEPGLPGEPHQNQQGEDNQHAALSEAHPAQLLVLVFDHLVRLPIAIILCATSKGLSQAGTTVCFRTRRF